MQASIKGKVSNPEKEAEKNGQKPEPPSPPHGEKLLERTRFNSVRISRLITVR